MNQPTYNHWSDKGLEKLSDAVEQLFRDSRPNDLSDIFANAFSITKKGRLSTYSPRQVVLFAARNVTEENRKDFARLSDVMPDDPNAANVVSLAARHPVHIGTPPNYMTPPGVAQAEHDHRDNMATRHQVRRNRRRNVEDTPNEGDRYNGARTAYRDGRCTTVGTLYAYLWRQQTQCKS